MLFLLPPSSSFRPIVCSLAAGAFRRVHHLNPRTFRHKPKRFATMCSTGHVAETTSITLSGGEVVEVSAAPGLTAVDLRIAIDSTLFQQWLKNVQSDSGLLAKGMSLKKVYIQGVDVFGSGVGFLKFKADVIDNVTGKKVPGIVFARGQSVAVLILLESNGKVYAVLTEQVRVPVGRSILELPAGTLDGKECDVVGSAVREVEEEIGISLSVSNMVNLTSFLDLSTGSKMFPSPGGCDEEMSLFLYRGTVRQELIDELQGKETGLRDHGELIQVHVVPYEKLWHVTADAKALASIAIYEMAMREGLLPRQFKSSPDTST